MFQKIRYKEKWIKQDEGNNSTRFKSSRNRTEIQTGIIYKEKNNKKQQRKASKTSADRSTTGMRVGDDG